MNRMPKVVAMRLIMCACCAFLTFSLGPLQAIQDQEPSEPGPAPNQALARMILPGTQDLQLIIQLAEPSVVEYMAASEGRSIAQLKNQASLQAPMNLQSSQSRSYQAQLAGAQRALMQKLGALRNVEVQGSVTSVMNAVIARVPAEQYSSVRNLPGVKKVHFSRPQRMHLDTAAALENAQLLWAKAGGRAQTGRGVKIGIIDSGIDITNPMLADSSLAPPAGFPKGESSFTNSKVIVARNYISLFPRSQRVQTAVDEVGHGTFIAGVAAGKQVTAPLATISGIAPGAFLGSYKIFGTPGVNDSTTTAAIVAAIDAAVADGMDVLNLSLGALDYLLPSDDPEITAIENAIASGVTVAISAGNDGPATHTISNPGATPDAITVGSVSNSRVFMSQLRVTAPAPIPAALSGIGYLPGDGPKVTAKITATRTVDVQSLDGNGYGCSTLPSGSLSQKLAIIQRGGVGTPCTFATKVNNAAAAGALAVVVYNNNPAGGIMSMGQLASTNIPAVAISNADGLSLKNYLAANPDGVQAEIDDYRTLSATQTIPRLLSSFSAVGPSPSFGIKPDLVAVGENVYSAAQTNNASGPLYSSTQFTVSQGTSFSAPMVAGAAAGLRQLFPSLGALAIKSLLTSTASRNLTADGVNPPSVLQAGSGLLDLGSASAAGAVVSPSNLNFGTLSYSSSLSLTQTVSIKNIAPAADQYTFSIEPLVPGPTLTLSQTSTGAVLPAASAGIDVRLQIEAPLTGGFQGFVVIRSQLTQSTYRIPYWAGLYVPDPTRILSVAQSAAGGNTYKSLASALDAARPGNIIEIADSGTYAAGMTISTNAEGLPLHGITIRAAAGQSPTLDGTGLTDQPGIAVIGLQKVLFQGLTISGGSTGILFLQPSTTMPLSATVDRCKISNTSGGSSASGIEVDGGGTLDVTKSVISNSSGTGIAAHEATFLTVFGSSVQTNAGGGIEAINSNVQILNSTVSGNTGPGLNFVNCSGTIDGSTFSGNRGTFGDGIEIADGSFTITNNTFDSNDRAGIGFFTSATTGPGPIVRFTGNTVRANSNYGILANPGQSLRIDSNLIKDNGRGIRLTGTTAALLVNNIIVRSTSSTSGNGVEVAGSSNVRMVNNTIHGNALQGIVLSNGASVSVFNTIVSSNRGGDVQALPSDAIQFSLVGDRALSGNNVTGDPKFVNPAADIFDLSPGSPALDGGSNSAASLPFLDFNGKTRVAPAAAGGSPAASGVVDIGAIEASSSYPLIYPLLANGLQPVLGNAYTTGIALLNYGNNAAAANFLAYNPTGALLGGTTNPATQTMGSEAQIPILTYQLFGFGSASPNLGAVLASSAQRLAGFFLLFDPDFKRFADGVNVSDRTGTDLVFMRHQFDSSGEAKYVLFNPGVNPANVTATLLAPSGTPMDAAKTAVLAPKGQSILSFNTVTSASGYVHVQSDRPISGLELYGDAEALSALPAAFPGTEARLFFPHIAVNQGFTTSIGLINPHPSPANIVLTAYDGNGSVLGYPASVTLDPNAQLLQPVSDLFALGSGPLLTGYVVAQADQPGIQGFTGFRYDDGIHKSAAAVPADAVPRQHLLFSHVAHQVPAGSGGTYQTGIALLNPLGTSVGYTMRVYDGSGKLVAEKSDILGPRQKLAKILSHPSPGAGFFTQPLLLGSGHIEVIADYALLGFELFFTEDFTQLASVPAQVWSQ